MKKMIYIRLDWIHIVNWMVNLVAWVEAHFYSKDALRPWMPWTWMECMEWNYTTIVFFFLPGLWLQDSKLERSSSLLWLTYQGVPGLALPYPSLCSQGIGKVFHVSDWWCPRWCRTLWVTTLFVYKGKTLKWRHTNKEGYDFLSQEHRAQELESGGGRKQVQICVMSFMLRLTQGSGVI